MIRPVVLAVFLAAGLVGLAFPSQAVELAPYKDSLFAYPALLSSSDGGRYRVVDYREMRDINGRDAIPERRVKDDYVSLRVRASQQQYALDGIRHYAVGKIDDASIVTIYLHGQGGSRKQGVDDFTFGGNFNRIKNLMVRNDGLYLSPDFPDFGESGEAAVAALIDYYGRKSPQARFFIACGSMGGAICYRLADNAGVAARLGGLILLGSHWDDGFINSAAFRARVPVFIGQGSRDTVFPVERQEAFFRSILAADANYPARFVRFETGTHGTPIRMTDWRETLNWMLGQR
ncbi:alpha/beta hydrolase [Nitratireductor mangrovi]|uniref:Alpha/beta hydrolase n=1 Tax=Nitratireductor mangrovi TaxID=2599600 RepID=A0A5B8KVC2_9HYPH|nr:alpha/beta hydrolase [Nitratireductor mangrovi]QDY99540.1 alpha/beta hydrolase [Nitratireductor mangrovi]